MVFDVRALRFGCLLALAACSRRAEIGDEFGGGRPPPPSRDDAGLSSVDAGFDAGGFSVCEARPGENQCTGANDFPCNFRAWAPEVVDACQTATGCKTNGRVVVHMGDDGCVRDVQMSEPNDAFVSCLAERFGAVRCPCRAETIEENLGYSNDGCVQGGPLPCGTGELRCPNGGPCVEGFCTELGGESGAAG